MKKRSTKKHEVPTPPPTPDSSANEVSGDWKAAEIKVWFASQDPFKELEEYLSERSAELERTVALLAPSEGTVLLTPTQIEEFQAIWEMARIQLYEVARVRVKLARMRADVQASQTWTFKGESKVALAE